MKKSASAAVLATVFFLFSVECAFCRVPLTVEGKKTLYQRVISHPGALLMQAPGVGEGTFIRPFTPFYIYSRTLINGEAWLEVSTSIENGTARWIRGDMCSRWDKALTLLFTDRMGRRPLLFFKSRNDLDALLSSANIGAEWDRLRAIHSQNATQSPTPLVALEPENAAVPKKNFYLMPVFDYSSEYEQYNFRLLNVGIINPGTPAATKDEPVAHKNETLKAGIAFIVDTTISMGPYIEKTKEFVRRSFDMLNGTPQGRDVALGLIAYRNNIQHNPKLEYVARVVSNLTPVGDRAQMEKNFFLFSEAPVSTHAFDEDAFAGVKETIDRLDWSPFAVKIAVLITDAGAIRNNDKYSSTGMNEEEMRDLLAQKGLRLIVVHLETPAGQRNNFAKAQRQYQILTGLRDANIKSAYIPLRADNAKAASEKFGILSEMLVKMTLNMLEKSSQGQTPQQPRPVAPNSPEERMSQIAENIGYAAQMDFVGMVRDVQAPQIVQAWTVDKDLAGLVDGKPTEALQVAVLLNKRQLDSLGNLIRNIVDAARASREVGSGAFFNKLVSLSAQAVVDPGRLEGTSSSADLVSLGVLPDFLENLPYKSLVMSISRELWDAMNSAQQDEFVEKCEAKLKLYREYHNDVSNWESFGSYDPSEALYRVPLTSLP